MKSLLEPYNFVYKLCIDYKVLSTKLNGQIKNCVIQNPFVLVKYYPIWKMCFNIIIRYCNR